MSRELRTGAERAAALIVQEWYDLCHNNPLDTRVLKRLIASEFLAKEIALRDALERIAHLDETEAAGNVDAAMSIARDALGARPGGP
ncbi:MAG: hypothetical protein ACREB3_17800 [Burkholderiales bacterium]